MSFTYIHTHTHTHLHTQYLSLLVQGGAQGTFFIPARLKEHLRIRDAYMLKHDSTPK